MKPTNLALVACAMCHCDLRCLEDDGVFRAAASGEALSNPAELCFWNVQASERLKSAPLERLPLTPPTQS